MSDVPAPNEVSPGLSRRSFLKGAGTVAGAAVLEGLGVKPVYAEVGRQVEAGGVPERGTPEFSEWMKTVTAVDVVKIPVAGADPVDGLVVVFPDGGPGLAAMRDGFTLAAEDLAGVVGDTMENALGDKLNGRTFDRRILTEVMAEKKVGTDGFAVDAGTGLHLFSVKGARIDTVASFQAPITAENGRTYSGLAFKVSYAEINRSLVGVEGQPAAEQPAVVAGSPSVIEQPVASGGEQVVPPVVADSPVVSADEKPKFKLTDPSTWTWQQALGITGGTLVGIPLVGSFFARFVSGKK